MNYPDYVKNPSSLSKAALVKIVKRIQEELFYDRDARAWDPDKEWDVETLDEVALHLDAYGLRPDEDAMDELWDEVDLP